MKRFILISLGLLTLQGAYAKNVPDGWKQQTHLLFIENKGQITDPLGHQRNDIQFKLQTAAMNVLIGNASLHYQWVKNETVNIKDIKSLLAKKTSDIYRMDVTLVGANTNATVITEQPQAYYEKYYQAYKGLNGTVAHSFGKITYQNVYPNIDWVIYSQKTASGIETMKYDFVVHPGGNPNLIQLKYDGSTQLDLLKDGSLKATTPAGSVTEETPYSYTTDKSNVTTNVASSFKLNKNVLSFNVAPSENTLTIDPSLEWATYYGGTGFDLGTVLTCDALGNVYLTGASWMSADIATTGSYQSTNAGDFDAFLAKFDNNGNRLWATYYGGASLDYGFGLACDQNNRVYISGITQSDTGVATTGSAQSIYSAGGDDFLVRFDTAGNRIWATYCGGSGSEYNGLCATDEFGHIYLTGNTASTDSIFLSGYQNANGGGANDAFLVQYDTAGHKLWGTFYGGSGDDQGDGVTCDRLGNVYMSGHTNSTSGIASATGFQTTFGGTYDDYLAKFNSTGALQWATYYGGFGNENNGNLRNITCDKNGNVYMAGSTISSTGIATPGAFQTQLSGNSVDAFLVKFTGAGARIWGTYYGGTGNENGGAIACDLSDNIFWCGFTTSPDSIATPGSHQTTYAGGTDDAFLTKFNSSGQQIFGTYYGGAGLDEGYAVGFDYIGNAFISGGTTSNMGIATPGAFSTVFAGGIAVFLAKFCTSVDATALNGSDSLCPNSSNVFTTNAVSGATGYIWTLPSGWVGTSDSNSIIFTTNDTGGVVTVKVIRCDTSDALTMNVYVYPAMQTPSITQSGNTISTSGAYSSYQWYLNDTLINGATAPSYTASRAGNYTVVVTGTSGCHDTSSVYPLSNITAINELQNQKDNLYIYPNPANNILNIHTTDKVSAAITSIDGRVLFNNITTQKIDISSLSAGVYIIKFSDKNGALIKADKFIKANQ
jgi:hypothetical protein